MIGFRGIFLSLALAALPFEALGDTGPGSRLWATGGITSIDGSAGGGITTWALLSSYASTGEWGGTASLTQVRVDAFTLNVQGLSLSYGHRVELSFARQRLDLDSLGGELEQDVYGAKVRLFGDAVYGRWGQFSLAVQHRRLRDFDLPEAVGARDDTGTDFFIGGSKLFLAAIAGRNLLVNAGVRLSRANQNGLLGFGGDRENGHQPLFEGSAGLFVNRQWLAGLEYRQKPDNLSFAREEDWWDPYLVYVPSRYLAVTAAWANLGDIAGETGQRGFYVSLQGTY